jgi:hypothetical protein
MSDDRICTFLRAKNALGTIEGGENPFTGLDTVNASFTCILTGEPFGPDDQLAHSSVCTAKRVCFSLAKTDSE